MLTAIIFDVEGTLIDCVPHVLACWQTVLAAAGHPFEHNELQR
jgi:beta-phosphoglucomutase-like phosphatase (HAD superfamily)